MYSCLVLYFHQKGILHLEILQIVGSHCFKTSNWNSEYDSQHISEYCLVLKTQFSPLHMCKKGYIFFIHRKQIWGFLCKDQWYRCVCCIKFKWRNIYTYTNGQNFSSLMLADCCLKHGWCQYGLYNTGNNMVPHYTLENSTTKWKILFLFFYYCISTKKYQ